MAELPEGSRSRELSERELALREDLSKEYYAILGIISEYDSRMITIKEWSVTVSLAGLGTAFVSQSSALFGLVAVTAATFWIIEALTKRFQFHFYSRMRDIEYAMF